VDLDLDLDLTSASARLGCTILGVIPK